MRHCRCPQGLPVRLPFTPTLRKRAAPGGHVYQPKTVPQAASVSSGFSLCIRGSGADVGGGMPASAFGPDSRAMRLSTYDANFCRFALLPPTRLAARLAALRIVLENQMSSERPTNRSLQLPTAVRHSRPFCSTTLSHARWRIAVVRFRSKLPRAARVIDAVAAACT